MPTFELDEEIQDMQKMLRDFATEMIRPAYREAEHAGETPSELRESIKELSVHLVDMPEEYGGLGKDIRSAVVLEEELSYGDVGITVDVQDTSIGANAILIFGTDEQKTNLLTPILESGDGIAACFSEKGNPVSPEFIETTWREKEGSYKLMGSKTFVVGAGRAKNYLVLAKKDGSNDWQDLRLFLIAADTPGVVVGDRLGTLGLETCAVADVALMGVKVDSSRVLSAESSDAFKSKLGKVLDYARIVTCARMVGVMSATSDYSAKYSTERIAFDLPISQHQSIAFMVSDNATDVDACRWMTWQAAHEYVRGGESTANRALAHVVERAQKVATDSVQILGGHGFIQDHPVEKWMRDLRALSLIPGNDLFPEHG
ncbi:MAG: acyl-CoA dehydrogenase family protein [Planctomycetes bacterium]|nr:acyl-CoA dehydrogenase family protein [Planctomycetota bacterium]